MGSQESSEAEKSDPAGRFRAPSHCPILDIFLEVMGRYTDQPQGRYLTVTGLLSDGLKEEVTVELRLE